MKPSQIILLIGVLAIAILGGYFVERQSDPIETPEVSKVEVTTTKKFVKNTDMLSVEITYPEIPGSESEIGTANALIKKEIDELVAQFENAALEDQTSYAGMSSEVKNYVAGSPSIEEKNDRYISIFMGMEWYTRGAAHPSHTIHTYVYDFENKKIVALADFFKPGSDYLNTLSTLSKEDLLLQSKEGDMGFMYNADMVEEGTSPKAENFNKVLPTKHGLVIYFDEYQVAPYAAGPQQVIIPYEKLKEIILLNSVLSTHIK